MLTLPDEIAATLPCEYWSAQNRDCRSNGSPRKETCGFCRARPAVLALVERREADWRRLRELESDTIWKPPEVEEARALRARLGLDDAEGTT